MDFTPSTYTDWARTHYIPVATEATWAYLLTQVDRLHPHSVVEIGAAVGSTTCRLGHLVASWNGQVVSYEVSHSRYHRARRWRNYTQCRNAHIWYGDVLDPLLHTTLPSTIDFVFIDGMKMQYAEYLQLIRPYCHQGSVIIMDDVRSYADKMDPLRTYLAHESLVWTIHDLDDGDGVLEIIC